MPRKYFVRRLEVLRIFPLHDISNTFLEEINETEKQDKDRVSNITCEDH